MRRVCDLPWPLRLCPHRLCCPRRLARSLVCSGDVLGAYGNGAEHLVVVVRRGCPRREVLSERPLPHRWTVNEDRSIHGRFPRPEDLWGRHGRRNERVRCRAEDRVGMLLISCPHGNPPAQHLRRIGAGRLRQRCEGEAVGLGAGCELCTSRSWCSILTSSRTSSRLNTSCTRLCR